METQRLERQRLEAVDSKFVWALGGLRKQSSAILVTVSEPLLHEFQMAWDLGMILFIEG